jgi:hypothetical protein
MVRRTRRVRRIPPRIVVVICGDAGNGSNLRGVMTALIAMGNLAGDDLVLPRWRIAFALRPGDLEIQENRRADKLGIRSVSVGQDRQRF